MYGKYVGGKMLDFYLSINNSEEVIHIPVTPSEFTVSSSQGTETFETANYGWIKIIGNTELKTVSWNSFFSMRDYPYLRDRSMKGQEYADKIENWRKRKLPIRLVITSSGICNVDINIAAAIDKFDYSVGTGGDLNYSIELGEVNLLNDEQEGLTVAQYDEIMARIDNIEERLSSVENTMIYNYMDDNMPSWAKPTIQKLMDRGIISGTDDNELGLTMDIIRTLVIIDKTDGFENYTVDIMPSWAEATIEKAKRKGYLNGDGEDGYGLTKSMIRLLVIMDNAGCFGD